MSYAVLLALVLAAVALINLLAEARRDTTKPHSLRNLSRAGVSLTVLTILVAGLTVAQVNYDKTSEQRWTAEVRRRISLGTGYNLQLRGVMNLTRPSNEASVRAALANVSLKFMQITMYARQGDSLYRSMLHLGGQPEVRRFLRYTADGEPFFARFPTAFHTPRSYYFELRFPNVRLFNQDLVQFVPLNRSVASSDIWLRVGEYDDWTYFSRLYAVSAVALDEIFVEELDATYPVHFEMHNVRR